MMRGKNEYRTDEQEILNAEVKINSTFDIPCLIFAIKIKS